MRKDSSPEWYANQARKTKNSIPTALLMSSNHTQSTKLSWLRNLSLDPYDPWADRTSWHPMPSQRHSHSAVKTARKKGLDIPRQVSKHTLPFIFRYFAIYVDILFLGCFEAKSRCFRFENLAWWLERKIYNYRQQSKFSPITIRTKELALYIVNWHFSVWHLRKNKIIGT